MSDLLTTIEEMNLVELLKEPHLSYVEGTLSERKNVAYNVLGRKSEEIMLIASSGFLIDSIFAGLSERHIEYIAMNGPNDYKKNILKIVKDSEMMRGVFEIAQAMDKDLGEGLRQNQERITKIVQYIKDNKVAFEF